jgi:coatomer protein complex subunit gamma
MAENSTILGSEVVKKRDEDSDDVYYSPFWGIEKGAVLQEARCFNDSQLDARRCQQVITKLLYLCNQGDTFTKTEATEVFFSVTKLFQSKDSNLRRMVYLIIKEVCPSSDEVIIVTSSLMKDMNSKVDLYRSNAIRVLCSITDAGLLGQIERYLKQAVVDKNSVVSSAALVSGIHLLKINADIVRRWSNEIQEAINSSHPMVQFHALSLLHQIRQSDRLAVSKLVTQLTKSNIRSPLAQCSIIRYVSQVISQTVPSDNASRPFFDFLEGCLRNKSEMVIFEAARAIINLKEVTARELQPAVSVLQLFLSSSKPVLRFGAVRAINQIALKNPLSVTNCNLDMENLISDQNRSIATLAITTLLKTGNESSIERLMKQITVFVSDIQDEFKIVVVQAIQTLCLKFPHKHRTLVNFLSNILREEGGFAFKKAIVDSIFCIIKNIPDAKDPGLTHLSEFIEDCEFTYLSSQILHLLGSEGPQTTDPSKYIRYIYNRVVLENAAIRASAISALTKFGSECPLLRSRVLTLLYRCLHDSDDEVRDRATLYVQELEKLSFQEVNESSSHKVTDYALQDVESSLHSYISGSTVSPYSISDVRSASQRSKEDHGVSRNLLKADHNSSFSEDISSSLEQSNLLTNPLFSAYGSVFKSSKPISLTEAETEYKVTCIVHLFQNHVVFEFKCTNTIEEQVLEDISVSMEMIEGADFLTESSIISLDRMPLGDDGSTFVIFDRNEGRFEQAKFSCTLRFTSKEIDPSTGEPEEEGYDDEYTLEDVDLKLTDYLRPTNISNFKKAWDSLPEDSECSSDYDIGKREGLQQAVEMVINILGCQPCEGTEAVPPNSRSHSTLLSGMCVGESQVLVRTNFGIDELNNVTMKITARSEQLDISELIHAIISDS